MNNRVPTIIRIKKSLFSEKKPKVRIMLPHKLKKTHWQHGMRPMLTICPPWDGRKIFSD